jgi:hypothetical protein
MKKCVLASDKTMRIPKLGKMENEKWSLSFTLVVL